MSRIAVVEYIICLTRRRTKSPSHTARHAPHIRSHGRASIGSGAESITYQAPRLAVTCMRASASLAFSVSAFLASILVFSEGHASVRNRRGGHRPARDEDAFFVMRHELSNCLREGSGCRSVGAQARRPRGEVTACVRKTRERNHLERM